MKVSTNYSRLVIRIKQFVVVILVKLWKYRG